MLCAKQKKLIVILSVCVCQSLFISREYACATFGKIAMESDISDNLFAAWALQNKNTEATTIFACVEPIGEPWAAPEQISGDKDKCSDPVIDVAENGNTVAMWLVTMDNGSNGLMVATLESVSAHWATGVVITESNENVVNDWYNISITSGGVVAIWASFMEDKAAGGIIKVQRTASAPFGGEWSAPETIS